MAQAVSKAFQRALRNPDAHSLATWDQDELLPLDPTLRDWGLPGTPSTPPGATPPGADPLGANPPGGRSSLISPRLLVVLKGYKAAWVAWQPKLGQAFKVRQGVSLSWLAQLPLLEYLLIDLSPLNQPLVSVDLGTLPLGLTGVRMLYLDALRAPIARTGSGRGWEPRVVFPNLAVLTLFCGDGDPAACDLLASVQVRIFLMFFYVDVLSNFRFHPDLVTQGVYMLSVFQGLWC